jgi:hypothetical protein
MKLSMSEKVVKYQNSGILQLNKIGPFWGSVVGAMFMTSSGKRRQNQIQIDKLNAV